MSLSESLYGELPEQTRQTQLRPTIPQVDISDRLSQALDGLMLIQEVKRLEAQPRFVIMFRGTLLGDAEKLYPVITERFHSLGYTPLLQRQGNTDIVAASEGLMVARRFASPGWVHALLLLVTIITTTLSGAAFQGYGFDDLMIEVFQGHNPGYIWTMIKVGAPFALTLLLILGIHEMGHYVAGRWHGIDVTLPYFIPLPFVSILGTLGAVIFIKSALTNRKALFDVGISGPLAGFVVALIAFIVSLNMPRYPFANAAFDGVFRGFAGLGMPPLLEWLGQVFKPGANLGMFVVNQPIALAAWFGMLLTVLNLLPIGQLDGGHVMYTLFGRFAWTIAALSFAGLIFLGLTVFPSFLFYGLLALLTGLRHPPPGNDITPLNWPRRLLGYATIVLFFLILTTTPFLVR